MTFATLTSADYQKIARAEAVRRIAAAASSDLTAEQRREDERTWSLITRRAAWFRPDIRALPLPDEDPAHARAMSSTVLRTARTALRRWADEGSPRGEPEARAFLILSLARKFAELAGEPRPYVDANGRIYVIDQQEQAA